MTHSADAPRTVSFRVNGCPVEVAVSGDDLTLLDVLRDQLGITSPKNGCQPQARCGCCTVLLDGKPVLACAVKPERVAGESITTLEGLDQTHRQQIADCFVACGGVQCGFCIPGIALRAVALCDTTPLPTRQEIAQALKPHLCRCTGYQQIVDSIERYSRIRSGQDVLALPADRGSGAVGTSLARYAGREAVLGTRPFIDDMSVPDMVFGALVWSDYPRATVVAIDAARAFALPGVYRVVTAADVPGTRYVGLIESDWPVFVAAGESTHCVGDVIAGVVASSQRLARKAAALIRVEYAVGTPVTDPHAALQPGVPLVHSERGSNLLARSVLKRGDVEAALAACAHVVRDTYRTQRVEHLYLEPESCLAVPEAEGGQSRMRVYSQGQGVYDDRRQIARVLGKEEDYVEVQLVSNGGAFGGKEDLSIQAQTALMAWLVDRPVKMTLSRDESFRLHPKRHPIEMAYTAGCDRQGRLLAVRAQMTGDTGAYASVGAKVLERAGGHGTGPYRVPNIDIETRAVYTNNPPSGAMRGFGANQAAFAIEGVLDRLAEMAGIDGYDMRDRNILEPGDTFATGQVLSKPFGLRKTLEAVKQQYKSAKYAGIACGVKNVGIGNGLPDIGRASLTVETDHTVHLRTGFTEMGQGLFTVCIQFAVEATGLAPGQFKVSTDTSLKLDCGQTTASRATVLAGGAIAEAGKALRLELDQGGTLAELVGRTFYGQWVCDDTSPLGSDLDRPGGPKTHLSYGFATQVAILDNDGCLARLVAAHDVGRVINPTQLAGQLYGALHMGIGYALTEDFPVEDGMIQAKTLGDCGVLRAHQMPEMELIFVEQPDPECPFGARGVGEIGLVPTAPAIAAALFRYDGIIRRELPLRHSTAAQAIARPQRITRQTAAETQNAGHRTTRGHSV